MINNVPFFSHLRSAWVLVYCILVRSTNIGKTIEWFHAVTKLKGFAYLHRQRRLLALHVTWNFGLVHLIRQSNYLFLFKISFSLSFSLLYPQNFETILSGTKILVNKHAVLFKCLCFASGSI